MLLRKSIVGLFILALCAGAAQKNRIGYYASWQYYNRNGAAAPDKIELSRWTRINFAFLQVAQDGSVHGTDSYADPIVLFGTQNWNDQGKSITYSAMQKAYTASGHTEYNTAAPTIVSGNFNPGTGLIDLAHAKGTEVYASIGGWTLSCNFTVVAADATKRAKFAGECARLVREWGLDGIDIDWEYPGYSDHHGSAADKNNAVLMMAAIRDSLDLLEKSSGIHYGLTMALPCAKSIVDAGIDVSGMLPILDGWNLMTYDFHGPFDAEVNHNSPLFHNGVGDSTFNVAACADGYRKRGVPAEKLHVGGGFYGRAFAGATEIGGVHKGADAVHFPSEGMPMYYDVVAKESQMTLYRDEMARVPYGVFSGGGLVSYEDSISLREKVEWLNKEGLGGIIIWEMSGDVMPDGSQPLSKAMFEAFQETSSIRKGYVPWGRSITTIGEFDLLGRQQKRSE